MTWDILPSYQLGVVGIVVHYQELYGAIIYYCAYFYNQRYKDQPAVNKGIVYFSNFFWIIAPLMAICCFYTVVRDGNASVFR